MCAICLDFIKGVMTKDEAWANLGEMSIEDPHLEDVYALVTDETRGVT